MAPAPMPSGLAAMAAAAQHRPPAREAAGEGSFPLSPREGTYGSPLQEVALSRLHERSRPLCLTCSDLAQGLDSARRLDALEWLVQAFDALNLSDAQLYSAFGLLDRFAAASPVPISAGPGAFAYVLAAMLVALKVSGTQRDLERAKRLVIEASGTPRPWAAVRKAELQILRRLGFRACTPTCLDFLERLLCEVLEAAPAAANSETFEPESRTKCASLARLLLELGVVHEPEAVYGSSGHPPLASALAALLLSLLAVRAPVAYTEVLREHFSLVDAAESVVSELAEAMRSRWQAEERKAGASAVIDKWKRKMGTVSVSVPSQMDMRHILPDVLKDGYKAAADDFEQAGPGRRLRSKQPQVISPVLRPREVTGGTLLLAPPTAVSRGGSGGPSGGAAQTEQAISKMAVLSTGLGHRLLERDLPSEACSKATSASLAAGARREVAEAPSFAPALDGGHHHNMPSGTTAARLSGGAEANGHRSCSALGASSIHGAAVAAGRYPPSQLVSALSRATASENISSWPLATGNHGQEAPPSPHIPPSKILQCAAKGATATAAHGAARPDDRSPEPLVELTHVLNMVHPTTARPPLGASGPTGGTASCTKPKPPSVASELLVSSALRLSWPPDRRKGVDPGVAAISCREAASVLREAAQYLEQTAANLDSGVWQARDLKGTAASGIGSESKRRRTFGGPSPTRASSPPADAGGTRAGISLTRGSPPVCRGIRV